MINEGLFPNLPGQYELTSNPDEGYNCLAYAAGIEDEWWDPLSGVWPDDIGPEDTIANLVLVYKRHGFVEHDGPLPLDDHEIIAIYGEEEENGAFYHAAKLRSDGRWGSKMGPDDDLAHNTLHAIEGEEYGKAVVFMKRKQRNRDT